MAMTVATRMQGDADRLVDLRFKETPVASDARRSVTTRGLSIETVQIIGSCAFDYSRRGEGHYLAVHDLKLLDGEATVDALPTATMRDLRERLTFAPEKCLVSGWSSLAPRINSYTAMTFDADLVEHELELAQPGEVRPMLYFQDAGLNATLRKIQQVLRTAEPVDLLHLETLGLLAAIEMDRLQHGAPRRPAQSGRLAFHQERLLRDYIEENLDKALMLDELATLARLSRFHFARAFKSTFGASPRQYVLARRIERVRALLLTTSMPMSDIATLTGFGGQARLSVIFRKLTGCTPTQFRRDSPSASGRPG